jgi:vacuolar-type H+-ATPase subunit H
VQLSQVICKDLQSSHKTMVTLFYKEITNNINDFIEDIYTPFIINNVLKKELENYNKKESYIFGALEDARKIGGKAETEKAFNEMTEFLEAANTNIAKKKNELLAPIQKQEAAILLKIDDIRQGN